MFRCLAFTPRLHVTRVAADARRRALLRLDRLSTPAHRRELTSANSRTPWGQDLPSGASVHSSLSVTGMFTKKMGSPSIRATPKSFDVEGRPGFGGSPGAQPPNRRDVKPWTSKDASTATAAPQPTRELAPTSLPGCKSHRRRQDNQGQGPALTPNLFNSLNDSRRAQP